MKNAPAIQTGPWNVAQTLPKPYVATGHQTRRKLRDRSDFSLKKFFCATRGPDGLDSRPRMYQVVLR